MNRGTATLTNCTITGNSATSGGGMDSTCGMPTTLINCTVSNNSSELAAAFSTGWHRHADQLHRQRQHDHMLRPRRSVLDGTRTLTNCTVSGNSTTSYGGGLFI